ncbi:hypothetical protein AAMO2058_000406000 [Amorphochlora amoebiformis]
MATSLELIRLVARVFALKANIDAKSFVEIFARTLRQKFSPLTYRRIANKLRKRGIRIPQPPLAVRFTLDGRRVHRSGKPRDSRLRPRIDIPTLPHMNHMKAKPVSAVLKTPDPSPRTPILASALLNFSRQLAARGAPELEKDDDGFAIPFSPNAATSTAAAPASRLTLTSAAKLVEKDEKHYTPRPKIPPLSLADDMAYDNISGGNNSQIEGLLGAAWNAPTKRRLDFPSPVPLQRPRGPGEMRIAVIRKRIESKKAGRSATRSRRIRKKTLKGQSFERQIREEQETEEVAPTISKDSLQIPNQLSSRPNGSNNTPFIPMSPGSEYLFRNFVAQVSPLLHG